MTELTAQERAALALWLIQQEPLTTRQVAERCDFAVDSARVMLKKLCRVVPIYYDGHSWTIETDRKP